MAVGLNAISRCRGRVGLAPQRDVSMAIRVCARYVTGPSGRFNGPAAPEETCAPRVRHRIPVPLLAPTSAKRTIGTRVSRDHSFSCVFEPPPTWNIRSPVLVKPGTRLGRLMCRKKPIETDAFRGRRTSVVSSAETFCPARRIHIAVLLFISPSSRRNKARSSIHVATGT